MKKYFAIAGVVYVGLAVARAVLIVARAKKAGNKIGLGGVVLDNLLDPIGNLRPINYSTKGL